MTVQPYDPRKATSSQQFTADGIISDMSGLEIITMIRKDAGTMTPRPNTVVFHSATVAAIQPHVLASIANTPGWTILESNKKTSKKSYLLAFIPPPGA